MHIAYLWFCKSFYANDLNLFLSSIFKYFHSVTKNIRNEKSVFSFANTDFIKNRHSKLVLLNKFSHSKFDTHLKCPLVVVALFILLTRGTTSLTITTLSTVTQNNFRRYRQYHVCLLFSWFFVYFCFSDIWRGKTDTCACFLHHTKNMSKKLTLITIILENFCKLVNAFNVPKYLYRRYRYPYRFKI